MKKTIVWMLIMAMMLALLAGCVEKQELPMESVSNTQETEAKVTEIQEEETQFQDVEAIVLPEDEFDDIEETEAEQEESTEPVPAETNQKEVEATQPTESVDQNSGSIDLPMDEF